MQVTVKSYAGTVKNLLQLQEHAVSNPPCFDPPLGALPLQLQDLWH